MSLVIIGEGSSLYVLLFFSLPEFDGRGGERELKECQSQWATD